VELLIELQEDYDIRLVQADLQNVKSLSDLALLIAARAQGHTASESSSLDRTQSHDGAFATMTILNFSLLSKRGGGVRVVGFEVSALHHRRYIRHYRIFCLAGAWAQIAKRSRPVAAGSSIPM